MTPRGSDILLRCRQSCLCWGSIMSWTRRNAVGVLMGVELILNAASINLVAFAHYGGDTGGRAGVLRCLVIVLAAAEAAVALAIVVTIYKRFHTIDVEEATILQG